MEPPYGAAQETRRIRHISDWFVCKTLFLEVSALFPDLCEPTISLQTLTSTSEQSSITESLAGRLRITPGHYA